MEWMILPLKRYAQFGGRSRRMEYWMFILFLFLVYAVLGVVFATAIGSLGMVSRTASEGLPAIIGSLGIFVLVLVVFWLAMLLPSLAVAVRRLHDSGRSGWWLMLYFAPYVLSLMASGAAIPTGDGALRAVGAGLSVFAFVAALVLLVFMFLPGTVGPNRFGPDPKDPAATADLRDVFG